MIERKHGDSDADPRIEEVVRMVEAAASEDSSIAAEAEALASAPGLDRVEEFLSEAWDETDARRPRRWVPRFFLALSTVAAAVALTVVLWQRDPEPNDVGPTGTHLNIGVFELVHPKGRVTDWNVIEWSGPEGARYVLRVLDETGETTVYGPQYTEARRQEFTQEITDKWPDKILIEIEMRGADGTPEYRSAEAERTGS